MKKTLILLLILSVSSSFVKCDDSNDDPATAPGEDSEYNQCTIHSFPLLGSSCDSDDSDLCENGTYTCNSDNSALECVNESISNIVEQCDGFDNNCDGSIDENWPELGSSCDSDDSDSCENGTYTCTSDYSAIECINESVSNIVEICGNSIDDNCDGFIDSDVEICDGIDNNCDGSIDENWPDLDAPCDSNDSDFCKNGTWECNSDGNGLVCENEVTVDIVEICDNVDNDCDGHVDNLAVDPLLVGCSSVGVCSNTSEILVFCGDPNLICDYSLVTDWEENETLLDQKDNDCDGSIDEFLVK